MRTRKHLDRYDVGNALNSSYAFSHRLYRSWTRSRLTMTRTGNPGRIVNVGYLFGLRRTIS